MKRMTLAALAALPVLAWTCALPLAQQAKRCVAATAVVHPTKGNTVKGVVQLEQVEGGCRIAWDLEGLAPGQHGFHIHELGDCNCDDGKCTGGHFNPAGRKHGAPSAAERHVGDLGNIEAGADGRSKGEMIDKLVTLNGPQSVVGRAILVHADPDDLATDPTGNAGARIGVGVIGIRKEE